MSFATLRTFSFDALTPPNCTLTTTSTVGKSHKSKGKVQAVPVDRTVETELDTRRRIDADLRAAGWEVDPEKLRFALGARRQRGVNRAIAEWPTDGGAFTGLTVVPVFEARRQLLDVAGADGEFAAGLPAGFQSKWAGCATKYG